MFEEGLLGVGATIAASLLGIEWSNAWLTNVVIGDFARWMEYRPLMGVWFERLTPIEPGSHFPYGYTVEPP